jgi:integrase
MARKSLSDRGVRALKPRATHYAFPDPELVGHYVRVQPSGAKSYAAVTRNPAGKQIWTTVGSTEVLPIAAARLRAREIIQRVHDGLPAVEPKAETFGAVAANWLKRHVGIDPDTGEIQGDGLRSAYEINRLLNMHVLPLWKDREFLSIRRSDVAALLDEVEDDHGARQADLILAYVRSIMNWYATRHDDYGPRIVRGMRRTNPKERARKRKLSDEEIRAVWKIAEANGTFGALVLLLLLTGQRLAKVVAMRWQDISINGAWTIPTEKREKGNAMELVLPKLALDIIRARPQLDTNPYVLAGLGNGHFNGLSKAKRAFQKKLAVELPDMPQWQLHDLRRTARSLMPRAGVASEHAERVLGHALEGVEGVYNVHAYRDEKAEALRRLAALLASIVHPQPATVVPMARPPKRRR